MTRPILLRNNIVKAECYGHSELRFVQKINNVVDFSDWDNTASLNNSLRVNVYERFEKSNSATSI